MKKNLLKFIGVFGVVVMLSFSMAGCAGMAEAWATRGHCGCDRELCIERNLCRPTGCVNTITCPCTSETLR